jgi:hypothetical protein
LVIPLKVVESSVRFYNLQWDNQSEILALEAHKGGELIIPGKWKTNRTPYIFSEKLAHTRTISVVLGKLPDKEIHRLVALVDH